MKRQCFILIIALFAAGLSCNDEGDKSGCKQVKTMAIQPDLIATKPFKKNGEADWSCWPVACFHTHGTACSITVNTTTQVQVGYDYKYDNGTPPCNCWWYVDCVFRGGVSFDLTPLQGKGIVGAKLKWSGRGSCASRLFAPSAPWGNFELQASEELVNPWPANSSGPGQLEVGQTVRDWVLGNAPNRGFLFVGPDESFPNYLDEEGSAEIGSPLEGTHKCTSAVQGFQLEVKYTD